MTNAKKKLYIKYSAIVSIILIFFAVFYGLSTVNQAVIEKCFIQAAQETLKISPATKDISVKNLKRYISKVQGLSTRIVLSGEHNGKKVFFFFIPLSGKYGIYTGVFFQHNNGHCIFCGLAGAGQESLSAAFYGISHATIMVQKKTIQRMMQGLLQEKNI